MEVPLLRCRHEETCGQGLGLPLRLPHRVVGHSQPGRQPHVTAATATATANARGRLLPRLLWLEGLPWALSEGGGSGPRAS